jgi:hypothetical protein
MQTIAETYLALDAFGAMLISFAISLPLVALIVGFAWLMDSQWMQARKRNARRNKRIRARRKRLRAYKG